MSQWCPVVATTFAHLHSTNPELRFFTGSNPAAGVSEVCDDENIRQWSLLEIMPNILSDQQNGQSHSNSSLATADELF